MENNYKFSKKVESSYSKVYSTYNANYKPEKIKVSGSSPIFYLFLGLVMGIIASVDVGHVHDIIDNMSLLIQK